MIKNPEVEHVERIIVPVCMLESLALSNVVALKLDAEGAELEIPQGGSGLLLKQRSIITVELEERHRKGCTTEVPKFLSFFGYAGYFELEGKLTPIKEFDSTTMHCYGISPGDHTHSTPYSSWFVFLPINLL